MTHTVTYGTTPITFSIDYYDRKTLGIAVHPDGSVVVKAPCGATELQIHQGVLHRAPWICKQQRYFREFGIHNPPRRYVNGESHLYLGRQYMLRINKGSENQVQYHSNILEIVYKDGTSAKKVLQEWYRERASIKFNEYAKPIIERFKKYDVTPSSIEIRQMKTRWGSCTMQDKITLNVELIRAPRICIEYVITHELCHLVHKNHTKAFYELLSKEMPQWERWKMKLEKALV